MAVVSTPACRGPAEESARSPTADARPAADAGPRLRDARTAPAERDPDTLGRAGPVTLDRAGFTVAVDEARILQQWRRGEAPPMEALNDIRLRRRIMTQALETRVIRREVVRRGLSVEPERLDEMLRLAAVGHRMETPATPQQSTAARALADPLVALVERFGAPAERVRRVALDVLEAGMLADALLSAVPEERVRQAWLDANTRITLDLVRISRVPTSAEIDRAVVDRRADAAAYYAKNRRLFRTPQRAYIRRLLVPVADGTAPAGVEAARARAEALRAQVEGGADLEALARTHGPPRDARSGGRVRVTPERLPAAFEGPVGALSAVMRVSEGWQFHRVESRAAAVERPLDDVRVQREIAAALLREADALPSAKRTAAEVRRLLGTAPDGEALAALVRSARLQRTTTESFSRAGPEVVPDVGIAPELFTAVFALTPEAPVTTVTRVRQWYVVARLVDRTAPEPAVWATARARYTATWRRRQQPVVVDEWLSSRLKGRATWIDTPRLTALTLEEMGIRSAAADGEAAKTPTDKP